ncbi:MAG: mRNA surveillance protein pelota [Candidatus Thermoplasmatota archaeon]|nr:mRNA surveillance protein pelota [Candidatus Thermoplasmatota archaeon]
MRILHFDENSLDVQIEGINDLWYIENIIHSGDSLLTAVRRRTEKKEDMARSKETERVTVTVTLQIEKVEFQAFSNRLRVLGLVTSGPDDIIGEHQSAILKPGDVLKILKQSWDQSERKMLQESTEESSRTTSIFIAADDDEANLYLLRPYGIQNVGHIDSGKSGKYFDSSYSEESYFQQIAESIRPILSGMVPINILGPGFARDHIAEYLKQRTDFSKATIVTHPSSRTDEQAIYEYLGSEEAKKSMESTRLSIEKNTIDSFMKALKSGGLATYGFDQVHAAIDSGAVATLLVSEERARDPKYREIMEKGMRIGAKISILSSHSDPGMILKGFGGVSAILRYAVS